MYASQLRLLDGEKLTFDVFRTNIAFFIAKQKA